MMERAAPIPGVLGEHPDRCVRPSEEVRKTIESAVSPDLQARWKPTAGRILQDTGGGSGILASNPASENS